ncbi:PREDICTED: uncharacterized protein LOC108354147, partial [Rhagoletis zephyria]|uniref:uncharacterized protein LOC108354147 n=1 Tax=Rhagoletis zephyria TaxID=28612 RepID=UPI0008119228
MLLTGISESGFCEIGPFEHCVINTMTENTQYTSHEYADIHLIYGEACCNARAAQRIYAERDPNRRHPGREVFALTYRKIYEGRIPGRRGGETGRPATLDVEVVLEEVELDPSTS